MGFNTEESKDQARAWGVALSFFGAGAAAMAGYFGVIFSVVFCIIGVKFLRKLLTS